MDITLVLVDPFKPLIDAWQDYFADLPRVEIIHGYFEKVDEYDCMVSAANSFGLMDGGGMPPSPSISVPN